MRGRKPKPTALKIAQGNPGKRPLPENEPTPSSSLLSPPNHVKGSARAEWVRVAPLLAEQRISTQLDLAVLENYCVMYGRAVACDKQIRSCSIKDGDGNLRPNPLIETSRKTWAEVRRAAIELGLTPSSRSRVSVEPKVTPEIEESLVGW